MTRNRLAEIAAPVQHHVVTTINATIQYHIQQDPLSREEKIALWHWDVDEKFLNALALMRASGISINHAYRDNITFAVPEWGIGIRWRLAQGDDAFLRTIGTGPFKMKVYPYGNTHLTRVAHGLISDVLGDSQTVGLHEWAKTACQIGPQCGEAINTVREVFAMVKTAGQLKRMVPDLVQYLPPLAQEMVNHQERRSPFPDKWAEYDKGRVERMLTTLARGHLVKTLVKDKNSLPTTSYTWAQALPNA